jgi:hypothetical protein
MLSCLFIGRNPFSIFLFLLTGLIFSAAIVLGNEEVLKIKKSCLSFSESRSILLNLNFLLGF